jgi:AcrR family transcriptional regulator
MGRRQSSIDRTSQDIVEAGRRLIESGPTTNLSVGRVAREAGVTRATVYNRYGSRDALLRALEPTYQAGEASTAREYLAAQAAKWAASPALFRRLPPSQQSEIPRRLAEALAAADQLRPGCSIREAADVLAVLGSFAMFDALFHDGGRSTGQVVEILVRLTAAILA